MGKSSNEAFLAAEQPGHRIDYQNKPLSIARRAPTERLYVMTIASKISLFTPGRTGSQFVYELLRANLGGIELLEWLSESFTRSSADITDDEFLHYVRNCLASSSSPFAIKITPAAFSVRWDKNRQVIDDILEASGSTNQILLYRQDFWGACISNWMANRTGIWHSNQPIQSATDVDFKHIVDYVIASEKQIFEAFAKYSTGNPLAIAYESLVASPITFAHEILRKVAPYAVGFASINLSSATQRVLDPMDQNLIKNLCEISDESIAYLYEQKSKRDHYLHGVLSKLNANN